jgi:hypothetical protein
MERDRMERWHLGIALLLVGSLGRAATAEFAGPVLAGRSASPAFGGEPAVDVLPDLNRRLGVTFFPLSARGRLGDVRYDFDIDVQTFPLAMDWSLFQNSFHVNAGLIVNRTEVDVGTRSTPFVTIGGNTYAASDLGTVRGDVRFNRLAPYLGLGWGNTFGKDKRWGIFSDLGVAVLGWPKVALSATGPIASDPTFQSDLAREARELEEELRLLRFYPVFSISLSYRF